VVFERFVLHHMLRKLFRKRKIDKSFLPNGYRVGAQDGLVAEFYGDRQLKHFGFYVNGRCDDYWVLNLEHGVEAGEAVIKNGYGGTPDAEIYKNGAFFTINPWSDRSESKRQDFIDWVKKWIKDISH
jgi:hypothetical protein